MEKNVKEKGAWLRNGLKVAWLYKSRLRDGQLIIILNFIFNFLLLIFISRWLTKTFEFANSFKDRDCVYYSLLSLIPSSYWLAHFPDFQKNYFISISTEFCANPRNGLTNRKRAIAPLLSKECGKSKGFCIKWLRT
jgi:hypothetical protein